MKKYICVLSFFMLFQIAYSQSFELGKVTKSELQEKVHPIDTSAAAAFIFNKGKVSFEINSGYYMLTEVEVKIKIYKKEGYSWGNQEIPFFAGSSNKESVKFSNAVTYNLVNGEIQKTKAKEENEFLEILNKSFNIKKISMPNVKEGSIIEYKYTIITPFISSIRDWEFQKSIPVNHSELTTDIPEYVFYNIHKKGSLKVDETKNKLNKYIVINQDKNSYNYRQKIKNNYHDIDQISYIDNRTVYTLENIPALKNELFVNNVYNYASVIEHELSGVKFPNMSFESFANTWEDIARRINESEYIGDQINKTSYFEEDISNLLKGLSTVEEKTNAIFKYVQSRMNWNNRYSYSCFDGVKKAYNEKVGNYAEINLMLVSMLRFIGLDANPVLVSTRLHGISFFPSEKAYNVVIASVIVDGNLVLMDATSKNTLPNILPIHDLNWFGRLIRKDGATSLVDLTPKTPSFEIVNVLASIDEKATVFGKVRDQYVDYNALKFREDFLDQSKDIIVQKIEKENNGLEIDDYELLNDRSIDDNVVEKYSFKSSNAIEIIGDKMYFYPMLQFAITENPFKQETRIYPIDFSYPYKDKCLITIKIPEGYEVESFPKPMFVEMENEYGSFSYSINITNSQVQMVVLLNIKTSIIPPDDYKILKNFFKLVVDKENEKIVLKKK